MVAPLAPEVIVKVSPVSPVMVRTLPFRLMSSTVALLLKVTAPSAAIVIASVSEAEPIVPPSGL